MSNEGGSYAPKSPDLSDFLFGGTEASAQQQSVGYPPTPFQSLGQGAAYSHQPQPHYTYQQAGTVYNDSPFTPQSGGRPQQYFPPQQSSFVQTHQSSYSVQSPSQPPSYWTYERQNAPVKHYQPPVPPAVQPPHLQTAHDHQQPSTSELASVMPPQRGAQAAQQPEIEPSPVKTKFPTARIKRIMQADEEVGKVAQQTPIAVGKALELFMVDIVRKGADAAKEKNSKRITAQMLKQAVEANTQWDFLQEIVSKVNEKEEASKSTKAKADTDSDEEHDSGEPKKKRGGRKKKAAA